MPEEDRDSFLRARRVFQENAERSGPAAGASYTLIGAILLFGGSATLSIVARHVAVVSAGGLLLGLIVGFVDWPDRLEEMKPVGGWLAPSVAGWVIATALRSADAAWRASSGCSRRSLRCGSWVLVERAYRRDPAA